MVARTINRNYAYPQCDPPLVKDRSDIRYLRDLAVSVDNDATDMENRIIEFLEQPDSARLHFAGAILTPGTGSSGSLFRMPFNVVNYDNRGDLTDLSVEGFRIRERGWYMIASTVRCTDGGEQATMCRHLRNGLSFQEGRRLEGPAGAISTLETNMATSDVMMCNIGDVIQLQVKVIDAATTMTFESRMTMLQLLKLDV